MQIMNSMLDSTPLDFDVQSSFPAMPAPTMPAPTMPAPTMPAPSKPPITQQPLPKPPTANIVKPIPKNPILSNKNLGFSNLPDLPSVPTDVPTGDIKEKDDDDEETDFDELLNRFEDLKKNKK